MFGPQSNSPVAATTSHRAVIPFYAYAALSFVAATGLLFLSSSSFTGHYFQPHILAITHLMALGWGTMLIFGASHQLVPVLIESGLYSVALARLTFALAGVGIPLLAYGFHSFNLGWPAQWGGALVSAAVLVYLVNIAVSIGRSERENVHAVFVLAASTWLLLTVLLGLALLFNFTASLLPRNSLHYLSLHAHLGVVGWFLLLVLGVGSRLIPMFLISKHSDPRLLWWVFILVNTGLMAFALGFLFRPGASLHGIPAALVTAGLLLFARFCRQAYRKRIRRKVDAQMKLSLLSVALLLLPAAVLLAVLAALWTGAGERADLVLLYGFSIFFGWLTAIILGMTFKTLPFIVWNKVYRHRAALGRMPNPKDLFHSGQYKAMAGCYLAGFILFAGGIMQPSLLLLKGGALLLLATACLYAWNVLWLMNHKPLKP